MKEEIGKLEDKEESTIQKTLNLRTGEKYYLQVPLLIPLPRTMLDYNHVEMSESLSIHIVHFPSSIVKEDWENEAEIGVK